MGARPPSECQAGLRVQKLQLLGGMGPVSQCRTRNICALGWNNAIVAGVRQGGGQLKMVKFETIAKEVSQEVPKASLRPQEPAQLRKASDCARGGQRGLDCEQAAHCGKWAL